MNIKAFTSIAVFIIVLLVGVELWGTATANLAEETKATSAAFTPVIKYREGMFRVWLIYTGQLNAYEKELRSIDASVFKVRMLKEDGTWLEQPLSGEMEPFDFVGINIPNDVISYSVYYDDGTTEYRIIDPKTIPAPTN